MESTMQLTEVDGVEQMDSQSYGEEATSTAVGTAEYGSCYVGNRSTSTSDGSSGSTQDQPTSQESKEIQRWRQLESATIQKTIYATLRPVDLSLNVINLYTKEYGLGRALPDRPLVYAPHCFDMSVLEKLAHFISFNHCHFERDFNNGVTYLHDTSKLGTYVNTEMIGNGNSRALRTDDVISVGGPLHYVFMYVEGTPADLDCPMEMLQNYFLSSTQLGAGAMGKVVAAVRRADFGSVAVKVIDKRGLVITQPSQQTSSESTLVLIQREVDIMRNVHHVNCVGLENIYESKKMAYIVMERVDGGELFTRIQEATQSGHCGLDETVVKFYAIQIVDALSYLHRKGIVHRDVKPENILLLKNDVYTVVKMTDFGLSKANDSTMQSFCGTQCYMAPEQWVDEPHYTFKVDMWSLGTVLFVALCGYPPFSAEYGDISLQSQICKGRLLWYRAWRSVTRVAQEFVKDLLRVNPDERLSADDARKHPWFDDPDTAERVRRVIYEYQFQNPRGVKRKMDESLDLRNGDTKPTTPMPRLGDVVGPLQGTRTTKPFSI